MSPWRRLDQRTRRLMLDRAREVLHLAAAARDWQARGCHLMAHRVRLVLPIVPAWELRRMLRPPEFELVENGWRSCAPPLLLLTWRSSWAHRALDSPALWWLAHTKRKRGRHGKKTNGPAQSGPQEGEAQRAAAGR